METLMKGVPRLSPLRGCLLSLLLVALAGCSDQGNQGAPYSPMESPPGTGNAVTGPGVPRGEESPTALDHDGESSSPPGMSESPGGCSVGVPEAWECWTVEDAVPASSDIWETMVEISPDDVPPLYQGGPDFKTLLPDGTMVGSRSPGRGVPLEPPLEVGIYKNGQMNPFVVREDRPYRQVAGQTWDGETIVWVETSSTSLQWQDWWLLARVDGSVHALMDSSMIEGGPELPFAGETNLTLVDGNVYLSTALPLESDRETYSRSLIRVPLGDPDNWVLEDVNVGDHIGDGSGSLYYLRSNAEQGTSEIVRVSDGSKEVLYSLDNSDDYYVTHVAASEKHVAWSVLNQSEDCQDRASDPIIAAGACEGWIGVRELATGTTTAIQLQSSDVGLLSLSGDYLAWGKGSGFGDRREFLLDLGNRTITVLGACEGCSYAAVAGSAVVWTTKKGLDGKKREYPNNILGMLKNP